MSLGCGNSGFPPPAIFPKMLSFFWNQFPSFFSFPFFFTNLLITNSHWFIILLQNILCCSLQKNEKSYGNIVMVTQTSQFHNFTECYPPTKKKSNFFPLLLFNSHINIHYFFLFEHDWIWSQVFFSTKFSSSLMNE